jgi:integrase
MLCGNSERSYPLAHLNIPTIFADQRWQSCFEQFLQSLRAEHTRYAYSQILKHFFASCPGRSPDAFRKSDVETFIRLSMISTRSGGKLLAPSAGTINFRLSSIKSFFDFAATFTIEGPDSEPQPLLQRVNPATGIKHHKRGRTHRTLSDEEIARLFSVIPPTGNGIRDRTLFYSFLMLGRRKSELLNLRWSDIEETIFVEHGQSRPGYRYSFLAKGKTSRTWAEMPGEVFEAIQWLLLATGRLEDITPESYIFIGMSSGSRTTPDPNKPLNGGSILRTIKRYAVACGISADRACIHLLRHVNAQQRLRNGQTLVEISSALGHSSIATTSIYLQSLQTESDTGAPALAAKFGSLAGVK